MKGTVPVLALTTRCCRDVLSEALRSRFKRKSWLQGISGESFIPAGSCNFSWRSLEQAFFKTNSTDKKCFQQWDLRFLPQKKKIKIYCIISLCIHKLEHQQFKAQNNKLSLLITFVGREKTEVSLLSWGSLGMLFWKQGKLLCKDLNVMN